MLQLTDLSFFLMAQIQAGHIMLRDLFDFQTFFGYFHVFFRSWNTSETVLERLHSKNEIFQKNRKIPFLVIFHLLWSKNPFLKKVGRCSSHNLFSVWYFLILHALGYLKPVTVFLYIKFGSTSPSAWCDAYAYTYYKNNWLGLIPDWIFSRRDTNQPTTRTHICCFTDVSNILVRNKKFIMNQGALLSAKCNIV
jgi:hypothetical protein